jgi:hypothetical protein
MPAIVKVFNTSNLEVAVSQKSFFKCDKVSLKWNNKGSHLLVLAETEVDKSGKSYMGESTLYLLSSNGGFDSRVELGIIFSPKKFPRSLNCIRQGRPYLRCHLVSQFAELLRCIRLRANEDYNIHIQSRSNP